MPRRRPAIALVNDTPSHHRPVETCWRETWTLASGAGLEPADAVPHMSPSIGVPQPAV